LAGIDGYELVHVMKTICKLLRGKYFRSIKYLW